MPGRPRAKPAPFVPIKVVLCDIDDGPRSERTLSALFDSGYSHALVYVRSGREIIDAVDVDLEASDPSRLFDQLRSISTRNLPNPRPDQRGSASEVNQHHCSNPDGTTNSPEEPSGVSESPELSELGDYRRSQSHRHSIERTLLGQRIRASKSRPATSPRDRRRTELRRLARSGGDHRFHGRRRAS